MNTSLTRNSIIKDDPDHLFPDQKLLIDHFPPTTFLLSKKSIDLIDSSITEADLLQDTVLDANGLLHHLPEKVHLL